MYHVVNDSTCMLCNRLVEYHVLFTVGHGKSDGDRVHIDDFQIYVRDLVQHIELLKAKYTDIPIFLMGHSMVR